MGKIIKLDDERDNYKSVREEFYEKIVSGYDRIESIKKEYKEVRFRVEEYDYDEEINYKEDVNLMLSLLDKISEEQEDRKRNLNAYHLIKKLEV